VRNKSKFTYSKHFAKMQYKLTRLNILTALPFFAKLLDSSHENNNINNGHTVFNELVNQIPKVLSTPETPFLLQQQLEMKTMRQIVKDTERIIAEQESDVVDGDDAIVGGGGDGDDQDIVNNVNDFDIIDDIIDDDDDDDDDENNGLIDPDYDQIEQITLTAEELLEKKNKIAQYDDKRKSIQYNVNATLESLWLNVFFGLDTIPDDNNNNSTDDNNNNNTTEIIPPNQYVRMTKLQALLNAYLYPQPSDRFPTGIYDHDIKYTPQSPKLTTMMDYTYNHINPKTNPLLIHLNQYQIQCYKQTYRTALYTKSIEVINTTFDNYYTALLSTDNLDTFITLLKDGYSLPLVDDSINDNGLDNDNDNDNDTIGEDTNNTNDNDTTNNNNDNNNDNNTNKNNPIVSFKKGFQDCKLTSFWNSLTDPKQDVPLRLEKLEIIILGHEHGEIDKHVWNNGRILYNYPLQPAVQFFHDDDKRSLWIDITTEYKQRREKWDYRTSDIPNRHSHHVSHPSFWARGYTNLDDFRKSVDKDEFQQYKLQHQQCCGFAKLNQQYNDSSQRLPRPKRPQSSPCAPRGERGGRQQSSRGGRQQSSRGGRQQSSRGGRGGRPQPMPPRAAP